jgi:16S rRNA (adenine1518-N6/adenine1519-N6)-dimethyltransferase
MACPVRRDDAGAVTLTRRDVRDLLDANGCVPSRALGQNFVVDPNTVRRIARLANLTPGQRVVEIGSGLGSLTLALVETGAAVTAVEVDRHLLPALRSLVEPHGVTVIEADALTADWSAILGARERWTLVANLPYNVATTLVLRLLDEVPAITSFLVLVQREAGERLVASPGSKVYGIPSVKVAYWATAELVGRVPATVFLPQPKVESVLVRITRRRVPAVTADPERLFILVRTAFGQRRKMLRRSLAGIVTESMFETAGVRPEARPEELGIEAWGRLADVVTGR